MAQTESWTILRLLHWTTDYLLKHGAENRKVARLEAELLLAEARSCQRIELYTAGDEEPIEAIRVTFKELVRRRAEGTPVAHLLGHREFYLLNFRVSPDVLIPRPETEHLVTELLDQTRAWPATEQPLAVVDVGTGSGCIAVTAAKRASRPLRVTAIDVSPPALEIAQANARTHQVDDRIEFLRSDLLEALPREFRCEFVVSNAPYITTTEMNLLAPEVHDHEPHLALHGGENGTDVIARLVPQAADRLVPSGWLLLEISPTTERAVRELLEQDGRFQLHTTLKDLSQHPRVIRARRK